MDIEAASNTEIIWLGNKPQPVRTRRRRSRGHNTAMLNRARPGVQKHLNSLEGYLDRRNGRGEQAKQTWPSPGLKRQIDEEYAGRRRQHYNYEVACLEGSDGDGTNEGQLTKHEWKAEFTGDVGAFSYPSLQTEDSVDRSFGVQWKRHDRDLPLVPKDEQQQKLEATIGERGKGEECLRHKKGPKFVNISRLNEQNSARNKDLVDLAPEWHSDSKHVYEQLAKNTDETPHGKTSLRASRAMEKLLKLDLEAKVELMLNDTPVLSQHASFSPALNYYASKKLRREMAEQKAQLFLGIDTSTKPGSRSNETHDAMRAKLRSAGKSVVQEVRQEKEKLRPIGHAGRRQFFSAYAQSRRNHLTDSPAGFSSFRETYQGEAGGPNAASQETLACAKFVEECLKRGVPAEPLIYHRRDGAASLSLANYGMGDALGSAFACSLPHLPPIDELDLTSNRLTPSSVGEVIEALSRTHDRIDDEEEYLTKNEREDRERAHRERGTNLHRLRKLDLSSNRLDSRCVLGLKPMIVGRTNRLVELVLARTNITDASMAQLCRAIADGRTLKRLDLSRNRITSGGGVEFARVIEAADCSIDTLDLSWNYIARAGASAIGRALASNVSLQTLYLAQNQFGPHAQAIGASLFVNKTLRHLDLAHNSIDGRAGMALGHSLDDNTTLEMLNLEGNALGHSGGRQILKAVTTCKCQCALQLRGCSFTDDGIFDRNRPANFSPYTLDMATPYQRTIMHELTLVMCQRPGCKMEGVAYTPAPIEELVGGGGGGEGGEGSGGEAPRVKLKPQKPQKTKIEYDEGSKKVTENGSNLKLPTEGTYTFSFVEQYHLPTTADVVLDDGLTQLIKTVKQMPTLVERQQLLTIGCSDIVLKCSQAQFMVDQLQMRQSENFSGAARRRKLDELHSRALNASSQALTSVGAVNDAMMRGAREEKEQEQQEEAEESKEAEEEGANAKQIGAGAGAEAHMAVATPPKPPHLTPLEHQESGLSQALRKQSELAAAGAGGGKGDAKAATILQAMQQERVDVMEAKDVIHRIFEHSHIVDQENVFLFVHRNLNAHQVHELIMLAGVQSYKFNSGNPTGHWRFDLRKQKDVQVLLTLAAVNEGQAHASRHESGRGDTSQHGDWNNFRNATYNKEPVVHNEKPGLTDKWINERPAEGILELDYVSTARPAPEQQPVDDARLLRMLEVVGMDSNLPQRLLDSRPDLKEARQQAAAGLAKAGLVTAAGGAASGEVAAGAGAGAGAGAEAGAGVVDPEMETEYRYERPTAPPVGEEPEFDARCAEVLAKARQKHERWQRRAQLQQEEGIGEASSSGGSGGSSGGAAAGKFTLSSPIVVRGQQSVERRGGGAGQQQETAKAKANAKRAGKSKAISVSTLLLEFHMMCTAEEAWFSCEQVIGMMDKFPEEFASARVQVMISCFARTIDLENWDTVMATVSQSHALEVRQRLGALNVWNPVKPYGRYEIQMSKADENVQLAKIMKLSDDCKFSSRLESEPNSEVPLMELYANLHSLPTEPNNVYLQYMKNEEASNDEVDKAFSKQSELLQYVLLGTHPVRPQILIRSEKPSLEEHVVGLTVSAPPVQQAEGEAKMKAE